MDENIEKKEPELKDFRLFRFSRLVHKELFTSLGLELTKEELMGDMILGFVPANIRLSSLSVKNEVTMKRLLLYKGAPEAMRLTQLQSTVPLNGWKDGGNIRIFSKVIEYNGKCSFCNFNMTQDNNLFCYSCLKNFNETKKIQMEGDSVE